MYIDMSMEDVNIKWAGNNHVFSMFEMTKGLNHIRARVFIVYANLNSVRYWKYTSIMLSILTPYFWFFNLRLLGGA